MNRLRGMHRFPQPTMSYASWRVPGGYTEAEIGEALELTERTVRRDWDKARMLLGALLKD
jgi:hypothetical protein